MSKRCGDVNTQVCELFIASFCEHANISAHVVQIF